MSIPLPPATHLLALLEAERERGFDGLAGSSIDATVPLRQAALDAAIAQVRGWPAALEALAVEIGDANRLLVTATVRVFGFRTPIRLHLHLAPSMEDGRVRLVIDDGSLMASAVALLGPMLGTLPPGVLLQGRQLTVDVRRLAAQHGFGDLAGMVSTATFESSRGVLWISVHLAAPVPSSASTQSRRTPRTSSAHMGFPFDVALLRAWLQGSHANVDLRIDERLANFLIAALHADAQAPSGHEGRDAVARALQQPVVRFESGVLRVTTTAALDLEGPSASDAGRSTENGD